MVWFCLNQNTKFFYLNKLLSHFNELYVFGRYWGNEIVHFTYGFKGNVFT